MPVNYNRIPQLYSQQQEQAMNQYDKPQIIGKASNSPGTPQSYSVKNTFGNNYPAGQTVNVSQQLQALLNNPKDPLYSWAQSQLKNIGTYSDNNSKFTYGGGDGTSAATSGVATSGEGAAIPTEAGGAYPMGGAGGGASSYVLPGTTYPKLWYQQALAGETADRTTEERALADREKALAAVSGAKEATYGSQAYKDLASLRADLKPTYSDDWVEKNWGATRDIAEGQKEAMKRAGQEASFSAVGGPSGSQRAQALQADIGTSNILSRNYLDLATQKAQQDRQDQLDSIDKAYQEAAFNYGVESDTAKELKSLYEQTIAKTPETDWQSVQGIVNDLAKDRKITESGIETLPDEQAAEYFQNPGDTEWTKESTQHVTKDGIRYYWDNASGTWKVDRASHKMGDTITPGYTGEDKPYA
jgi:hypothetical protein